MDDIIRQAIHDFRAYLQRRHYAAHTLVYAGSPALLCRLSTAAGAGLFSGYRAVS